MVKQDIVTRIVNSVYREKGIILEQINGNREVLESVVIRALQKSSLRKLNRYISQEELKKLVGVIGYGLQEKTGIDFGYCGEECMNGNYNIEKAFMCDHIRSACRYSPVEEALNGSEDSLIREANTQSYERDTEIMVGSLQAYVDEIKAIDISPSGHDVALFFCSDKRQSLE